MLGLQTRPEQCLHDASCVSVFERPGDGVSQNLSCGLWCRMVHDTDIVELELKSKRFSLAVRKKEALEAAEPTIIYQVTYVALHFKPGSCPCQLLASIRRIDKHALTNTKRSSGHFYAADV